MIINDYKVAELLLAKRLSSGIKYNALNRDGEDSSAEMIEAYNAMERAKLATTQTCWLMNSGDEKQVYYFNFEKSSDQGISVDHLVFNRASTNSKNCENKLEAREIWYDLSKVHVSTNDTKIAKTYCPENVFYGLNLITAKSRKVYFDNYDQMDQFIGKIIKLQGFADRFAQYEKL